MAHESPKEFSDILLLQKLPDEQLHVAACALLDRLKLFALFSKHRGFDEEKEWRVVYMRDRDQNKTFDSMFGYLTGPRGHRGQIEAKNKTPSGRDSGRFVACKDSRAYNSRAEHQFADGKHGFQKNAH